MLAQVFGPVTKPLYALRYGGPGKLEGVVEVGAPVMAVQQRAVFVNAAEAQRPVRSAIVVCLQYCIQYVAKFLAKYGHVWPSGGALGRCPWHGVGLQLSDCYLAINLGRGVGNSPLSCT